MTAQQPSGYDNAAITLTPVYLVAPMDLPIARCGLL